MPSSFRRQNGRVTGRRGGIGALLAGAHPGPSLVVTAVTFGLAVAVAAPPARVAALTVGMLLGQLSVGWSNDWLDAGRDRAAGRSDKPAAVGRIDSGTLRTAALVALLPGLALPFAASVPAGLLHLLFVAAGWSYNLALKPTPASVLPYLVAFGSLPSLATLIHDPPAFAPAWATAAGAALGVAAHFANVVPDVAADRAAGSRGLPQLLGARTAGVIAAVVVLLAAAAVAAGARPTAVGVVALALTAAAAAAGLVAALLPRPGRAPFRAVMASALLLLVALLASAGSL
jgi:4-hydroxybenzoate polyprenyltransferase